LLTAILAVLTGMFSADLSQWPIVAVEGHQGYSFAMVVFYIFGTIYVYTQPFKPAALFFYGLAILTIGATAWSGYQLVFH
jgi:hypothetical protein